MDVRRGYRCGWRLIVKIGTRALPSRAKKFQIILKQKNDIRYRDLESHSKIESVRTFSDDKTTSEKASHLEEMGTRD